MIKAIKKCYAIIHPIDSTQYLFVNLFKLASSSINILIYAFTRNPEWKNFLAIRIVAIVPSFKAKEDNNNEHVH